MEKQFLEQEFLEQQFLEQLQQLMLRNLLGDQRSVRSWGVFLLICKKTPNSSYFCFTVQGKPCESLHTGECLPTPPDLVLSIISPLSSSSAQPLLQLSTPKASQEFRNKAETQ